MEPTDDTVRRLAALGITAPDVVAFIRKRRRILEAMEERARPTAESTAAYAEWMPRLRAFAAARRAEVPVSRVHQMEAAEWVEYRVLLMRMREFRTERMTGGTFFPKPDLIRGVSTTRVGLAAAVEVFAGMGVVIMTATDWGQWRVVSNPSGGLRPPYRTELASWVRVGDDDPEIIRSFTPKTPPPAGSVAWVFSSSTWSGPLRAAGQSERWWWDGERLTFVEAGGVWIS